MHKLTFYNLGDADCIRFHLENGKTLLFDYAHMGDPGDADDLRCNLPKVLREDLDGQDYFDVVAFTHLDRDHYAGATDFFYFDHINKYQADVDGKPRIRINALWIPAAVITEELSNEADVEAKAIQKEARERFKNGDGNVRVFSGPNRLKNWCNSHGIDLNDRLHLITDAGGLVPGFNSTVDGIELFTHSPFAVRQNENEVEDRNDDALVMHATFYSGQEVTKLFLASDVGHDVLTDIVEVTESKGNQSRLEWDIFKLPHHCSHHSLSSAERTGDKSKPEPSVARLFEDYGQNHCIVVSTSRPIPKKGSESDKKGANPPHRQAANYYKEDVTSPKFGEFRVTMQEPTETNPRPLVIRIDHKKATVEKRQVAGASFAVATSAPRAG